MASTELLIASWLLLGLFMDCVVRRFGLNEGLTVDASNKSEVDAKIED